MLSPLTISRNVRAGGVTLLAALRSLEHLVCPVCLEGRGRLAYLVQLGSIGRV